MVHFLYNIGIQLARIVLRILALFNPKVNNGVLGREKTFNILEGKISAQDKTLWFHCASLGEYEQGLPVFEKLKNHYKGYKIVLSFFSPSGFENKKNVPLADAVVYLPLDTPKNASRFLDLVHPELTVFVKYDIWPNFLLELQKKGSRAILISAIFRKNQAYFKFYGRHLKKALFSFEHIFTQNAASKSYLKSIGFNKVSVSGDTRYDRVSQQLTSNNQLPFLETFKSDALCFVAGSTWPEGETLITNYINNHPSEKLKFIIAPHTIKPHLIKNLVNSIQEPVALYSEKETADLTNARVFIVDTIGLLSKIYGYANIAYVGGAVGQTGLHNTLEPAVFGVPIIIGAHYEKFPEAYALIENGGMFSIKNQKTFDTLLNDLVVNETFRKQSGSANAQFVEKNKGAVIHICDFLRI